MVIFFISRSGSVGVTVLLAQGQHSIRNFFSDGVTKKKSVSEESTAFSFGVASIWFAIVSAMLLYFVKYNSLHGFRCHIIFIDCR